MIEKMNRDAWATPMPVYLALDAEFDFQADLCASDSNAKHPRYLTEDDNALNPDTMERLVSQLPTGSFVWCNCPYSRIAPWLELANQLKKRGVGTVMLVMADSSVAWYALSLQLCSEIREVIRGRIAFLNPETGKPGGGNSKGSLLLIFEPFGRMQPPRRTYIERDQLMTKGVELMVRPELLFPELEPLSPELTPLSSELEPA